MKTAERFEKVINYFSEAMPVAETELDYMDPFELIVAVILSAQCTDKQDFQGVVPDTLEELQLLPGVGRKTANVILSVVFRKPAMAVDTHVFRVAARIGLSTRAKNPYETEMQLVRYIPEEKIPLAHHWLILHGRYICTARKPACTQCGIRDFCRYVNKKSKL